MTDKTINRFLDDNGKLNVWPSKQVDKQLALDYVVTKFDIRQTYTEAEVNAILKAWHTFQDWPLLRRSLIDSGLMQRDRSGLRYRRIG